jgi:hypothetical protein
LNKFVAIVFAVLMKYYARGRPETSRHCDAPLLPPRAALNILRPFGASAKKAEEEGEGPKNTQSKPIKRRNDIDLAEGAGNL